MRPSEPRPPVHGRNPAPACRPCFVFSLESASAPHRRPPSSAVSALVLSLTAPLLRAYLRVSRSEEHMSALQSPCNLVCRVLLEETKEKSRGQHPAVPVALGRAGRVTAPHV